MLAGYNGSELGRKCQKQGRPGLEIYPVTKKSKVNASPDSGGRLHAGVTLYNRYLIQETIGVGGMGAVYRAHDLHFPNVAKLVAVKEMINPARDPLVRETLVRNFEREANLLATLSHPAIPRIFDYFTQDERSYLILEFIQGKNLETVLSESAGTISEERILAWGMELCDVLHYLHTHKPQPIIFRDMKPSNVMINQHNHVVLVDFGIAKTFQTGEKGTMIGTEGYSPPEQYRGEATALADIYALGASFHHLLTRRDPRLEAPFSFGERPIHLINPGVSAELEKVVNTALEYNPSDRFQSAAEMRESLESVALRTGKPYQVPVSFPALPSQSSDVQPVWSFTCEDEVRGTPAIHKAALYVGSYDHYLYGLEAASGKLLWKYATDAGIVSKPAIQDDNLCFGSEDHRLHVVSARYGSVLWTYYTKAPVRSSPLIAEGHIFIGSDDACLHAINLVNGRRAWQVDTGGAVRSTPIISQDAIYFGNEAGEFYCVDYKGAIKWRFKGKRAITSSPVIGDGFLYFCSLDGNLYALEAKSGWVIWRFRMQKGSISSPFLADHLIFFGSVDGNIYCVDTRNAKEVWRFSTQHQVTGSPIIYKDSLYCGSVDGHLYCLDHRTGQLQWKFRTNNYITGTPIAHEDRIYIGSADHNIYALPAGN